jgi:hypothetical protein
MPLSTMDSTMIDHFSTLHFVTIEISLTRDRETFILVSIVKWDLHEGNVSKHSSDTSEKPSFHGHLQNGF